MVNRLNIVFHPYNKPMKHIITLKFQRKAILENNYIKYLGIMIDATLTWYNHIDNISKKYIEINWIVI